MTVQSWSDDERALVDAYAAELPPVAAIRAKVSARRVPGAAALRRPARRPAAFAVAAMAFAVTAAAVGAAVGIRDLHGERQPATVGVPPSPTPSPIFLLPTCRLPVVAQLAHHGGFLAMPSGAYQDDPTAVGQGNRYDGWPLAWDAPLHRWVRSSPNLVSPDGSMWLYNEGGNSSSAGALHLADAAGHDRVLSLPGAASAPRSVPLAWTAKGILYVGQDRTSPYEVFTSYRFFDPVTGAVRQSGVPIGSWAWYGGTTLWRLSHLSGDAAVESYDTATQRITTWFSVAQYLGPRPSESPSMTSEGPAHTPAQNARVTSLLAVDASGHPVIHLGTRDAGTEAQTLYLDAPGHVLMISQGVRPATFDPRSAFADAHGVWFLDYSGAAYLYTPAAGLRHVGNLAIGSRDVATIVGPCS